MQRLRRSPRSTTTNRLRGYSESKHTESGHFLVFLGIFERRMRVVCIGLQPAKHLLDRLPGAVLIPAFEVVVGGTLGDEIVRQEVPLATRAVLVEQGIDYLAEIDRTRSPTGLGRRKDGLDQVPLGVAQVGGIGFPHGCSPAAGGFLATPSPGDMLRSSWLSE